MAMRARARARFSVNYLQLLRLSNCANHKRRSICFVVVGAVIVAFLFICSPRWSEMRKIKVQNGFHFFFLLRLPFMHDRHTQRSTQMQLPTKKMRNRRTRATPKNENKFKFLFVGKFTLGMACKSFLVYFLLHFSLKKVIWQCLLSCKKRDDIVDEKR